ncbi:hypothetical protein [Alkalihalobacterium alkalinitrilicum]|nr:hypothetical protein [Alkalihalobacterium alkalinitrilicum]
MESKKKEKLPPEIKDPIRSIVISIILMTVVFLFAHFVLGLEVFPD